MSYNELTQRHFGTAASSGVLFDAGAGTAPTDVLRGQAGSRAQGTWVQFDLRVHADCAVSTIQSARFLAFACPHVIAVADWIAQQAVGKPVGQGLPETVQALSLRFGVPIEKLGRLLIVEDAWAAANMAPPPIVVMAN